MSYYVSKSKSRCDDPFSHTNSGIACINLHTEVYSLHKNLNLSRVRSSIGSCEEKIARDLDDEKTTLQEDIKQPLSSNEEQCNNSLPSKQHVLQDSDPFEIEIESLRERVLALQENKQELEIRQLLIYQGVKDHESTLKELQIVAEAKREQIELLGKMLESLEKENLRLKHLASDREALKMEMELAKTKMKEDRKQIQKRWRKKKGAMINLCQQLADQRARVVELSRKEEEMKKIIEGLHAKIGELKRDNSELVNDKIELMKKMDSVSEGMTVEKEAAEKALEEATRLKIFNCELAKQVEMYRSDRQADTQELIYLRWINACLRYELRKNHRPREMNSIQKNQNGVNASTVVLADEEEKRSVGYDTDCSSASIETEGFDSSRDLGSRKSDKRAKPKLIEKIKKWGDTKESPREVSGEGRGRKSTADEGGEAKSSANGHAKRIIAFCGKMDYVSDMRVLPRSRSMRVNATLCRGTSRCH